MAYVIPMRTTAAERGPQLLIIVLTKDNLERMRAGDPFDLQTRAYAGQLNLEQPVRSLDIVVAYEEDEALFERLAARANPGELIGHLERGRRHQPGDAAPPVSIKGKAGGPR